MTLLSQQIAATTRQLSQDFQAGAYNEAGFPMAALVTTITAWSRVVPGPQGAVLADEIAHYAAELDRRWQAGEFARMVPLVEILNELLGFSCWARAVERREVRGPASAPEGKRVVVSERLRDVGRLFAGACHSRRFTVSEQVGIATELEALEAASRDLETENMLLLATQREAFERRMHEQSARHVAVNDPGSNVEPLPPRLRLASAPPVTGPEPA